ncbi:MAG: hypothetical protein KIT80_10000 [Chitinophagaceae bacterium]|nr:hypothetical protein [Chitinophagaceae bacterium]MCW5927232.1 hypothetical protein [Chitinophagaceae bacterium]
MKHIVPFVLFVGIMCVDSVKAQDTLPSFTVSDRNGRIILNWVNSFPVVKQLSIQRSSDSLKGFKTILTLPDPTSVINGFLDNNAPDTVLYYKLYILLDSGKYVFSKSRRPVKKAMEPAVVNTDLRIPEENPGVVNTDIRIPEQNQAPVVSMADAADESSPKKYGMASANVTQKKGSSAFSKDTVTQVSAPAEIIKPSSFVFTNSDGNVTIVLPTDRFRQFSVKFFDPEGDPAFAINTIREHIIIVDRSNFMRSGIFRFELYENGVVKEKNKVQIPRFVSAK